MLCFSPHLNSNSPRLDFTVCPTLEPSLPFCLGLASPSLSTPDHWQVALCARSPPVRRSPPPAWSGKSDHQQHHRMYFSTSSPPTLCFPGMSYIFCKPDHQETASVPSPGWARTGKPLTANNGQTHQLCSHSACSFAEDLDPVPGASSVILENSDGHCFLLSDTKYCAHAGVPHCPDASFPRRFQSPPPNLWNVPPTKADR